MGHVSNVYTNTRRERIIGFANIQDKQIQKQYFNKRKLSKRNRTEKNREPFLLYIILFK